MEASEEKEIKKQLEAISREAFLPEKQVLDGLIKKAAPFNEGYHEDFAFAKKLVEDARKKESKFGAEGFIKEYGLDTNEGVMIMCLAEALLRIPDAHTADQLIQDSFRNSDWDKYLGKSSSLFVNASTWGLMLTGNLVHFREEKASSISGTIRKMAGRLGEPVIREALKKAMQIIGDQFVIGQSIEQAYKNAAPLKKKGFLFSFDMLGEAARSDAQARHFQQAYLHAIHFLSKKADKKLSLHEQPSISVKLSALYPRYELTHEEVVFSTLYPRLREIAIAAKNANMSLSIDAEETRRLELSLKIFHKLLHEPEFKDYEGLGFVLQAYHKRAMSVLELLIGLAKSLNKKIPLRLVKGAYWDTEIKHAQELGLEGYPVFTRKSYTDVSYLACAAEMLKHDRYIYPQFATHNALTIASILNLAEGREFEFQRLRGMGRDFYTPLLDRVTCRVYAPVGKHEDLLAYLIRRLLENGANSSFVNIIADVEKPLMEVLANPVAKAIERKGAPHPNIPLPVNIFSERKNSNGIDFGNIHHLNKFAHSINKFQEKQWSAAPLLNGKLKEGKRVEVFAPFDHQRFIGNVTWATGNDAKDALTAAKKAQNSWDGLGVESRASIIERLADLLEENRQEVEMLCVMEAGRCLPDAVSEVREAIDFCRYYAHQAKHLFNAHKSLPHITGEANSLELHGRGTFIAISPWNFPVSILTGQIVAALATGNCVIAKPAEQTPLAGSFMAQLILNAGVPEDVFYLLPGDGSIGKILVESTDIDGIVFTGSHETALLIQKGLSQKTGHIVPFIAETGGQNCMIVDSTALPEQVVDDVITSSFNSAGQRCSALRVLYLQEDIADKIINLLCGAVKEQQIGNPSLFATDIGPVIDETAEKQIEAHISKMKKSAKVLYSGAVPKALEKAGTFIAPHIFEIKSINELKAEVFGPVLHVIRYKAKSLDKIIEEINATGYGLTLGIHTRVREKALQIRSKIKAGNAYINRSQVGAVVGAHPFGGEGLSGTGPKAGGPHYLHRFVIERSTSINTAAIGGNLDLLS